MVHGNNTPQYNQKIKHYGGGKLLNPRQKQKFERNQLFSKLLRVSHRGYQDRHIQADTGTRIRRARTPSREIPFRLPWQKMFRPQISRVRAAVMSVGRFSRFFAMGDKTSVRITHSLGVNNFRRDFKRNWLSGWAGGRGILTPRP